MQPRITAATLERDRERRYKERQKIAEAYEEAAKIVAQSPEVPLLVVIHLRDEAKRWREKGDATDWEAR